MPTTTLTSREFNQDASGAKKAARRKPVFITDRGRPSHVLMSIEEYQRLTQRQPSIVLQLDMDKVSKLDFDPRRLRDGWARPVELD